MTPNLSPPNSASPTHDIRGLICQGETGPYKSDRMSRGRKTSLGRVCRLLLANELQEKVITENSDGSTQLWEMGSFVYQVFGGHDSQVCQRFQSSEGELGQSPDVIVLDEAEGKEALLQYHSGSQTLLLLPPGFSPWGAPSCTLGYYFSPVAHTDPVLSKGTPCLPYSGDSPSSLPSPHPLPHTGTAGGIVPRRHCLQSA